MEKELMKELVLLSFCWMDRRINKGHRMSPARSLLGADESFLFPTFQVDDSLGNNLPKPDRTVRVRLFFILHCRVINVITSCPEATATCGVAPVGGELSQTLNLCSAGSHSVITRMVTLGMLG